MTASPSAPTPGFEQGPIRPPSEARSLLVRVIRNCAWNRCTFCPVYKGSKASTRPLEDVLADVDAMAAAAAVLRAEGIGAVVLAGRLNQVVAAGGPALWLGAGFLVWWLFTGNYGLLVPAGVLGGLGAGLMLGETGFYGNAAALGLGAGFVAIFLLDTLRHRHRSSWWPLVPGAVLIALGLLQNTTGWGSLGDLGWPLFLIVAGVIVVGVALAGRGRRS